MPNKVEKNTIFLRMFGTISLCKVYVVCFMIMSSLKTYTTEELHGPAVSALDVRSRKLSNVLNGQSQDG
jgi:hypothetical protein